MSASGAAAEDRGGVPLAAGAGPGEALRWASRRWREGGRRAALFRLVGMCGVAVLVGALWLPEAAPQQVGDVIRHGGVLLEVAFVLGLLGGAVLLFGMLDLLLRSPWGRLVVLAPVDGRFVASERLRASLWIGLQAALPAVALFVFRLGTAEGRASLLFLLAAIVIALGVGLGGVMMSARAVLHQEGVSARGARAITGDAAGGVWSVAPGALFALLAVLLLVLRFGADEFARAAADPALPLLTRAAAVTLGLPLGIALFMALRGWWILRRDFMRVSARFLDGEVRGTPAGAGPWFEDRTSPAGWMCARWGGLRAMLVHKDLLQLARAHPFRRLAMPALFVLLLLVRWASGDALPVYGALGLLLIVQLFLLQPWRTLETLSERGGAMAELLVGEDLRRWAARRAVAIELGKHALIAWVALALWVFPSSEGATLLAIIPAAWLGQVWLFGRGRSVVARDERHGGVLGALAGGLLGAVAGALGALAAALLIGIAGVWWLQTGTGEER